MIPSYKYTTSGNDKKEFTDAINQILNSYNSKRVVRMVFFASDEHYNSNNKKALYAALQEHFKSEIPAWSFVAQMPLDSIVSCEVCEICDENFKLEHHNYGVIVKSDNYKEIIAGGITSTKSNVEEQCSEIFATLGLILHSQNFKVEDIVRQWNYIEKITEIDPQGRQHYQIFNDARSSFYNDGNWSSVGYPAATGIGTSQGGIIIDFNAVISDKAIISKIDNSLQIAAHDYSKQVLLGESKRLTTPKFERGKAVYDQNEAIVYISGTAAIRGEKSLKGQNAAQQIKATMENIDFLTGIPNLTHHNIECQSISYSNIRVYIKQQSDYQTIKLFLSSNYPKIHTLYLLSDVCRDELLVEVEGVALKTKK